MPSIFDIPKYRTPIEPIDIPLTIDYATPLLFLGSCFVENIGSLIHQLNFDVMINPFGTLYNPVSIADTLKRITTKTLFTNRNLHRQNDIYFSYATNTRFRHSNASVLLEQLNEQLDNAHHHFTKTKILFVTLGTAFVYRLVESGHVVANCQKQPSALFSHELLTINDIIENLQQIIHYADKLDAVVFTVSPIRHLKNGLIGNAHSKALLLAAIHEVVDNKKSFYFPSYEIVLDDLRDYRYYDSSLTHLSEEAKQYIFSYFATTFFTPATITQAKQIEKENKRKAHRVEKKNN